MAMRSYKFRFYPTPAQIQQLEQEFGCARFVWNHCLSLRGKVYRRRGESLNYVGLNKHLTHLKSTTRYGFLKNATAACLTQKLIDLDKAFAGFFKQGMKYPRFKKKAHTQSIRYQLDQRLVASNYRAGTVLKLPKLGAVKVKWSRLPGGIPKMVTVSKTATGQYFLSLSCEESIPLFEKTNRTVGVDVGIKDVAVTSAGDYAGAPKFSYRLAWKLKKAQRRLKRMERTHGKGSNRQRQQRLRIARLHQRIADARRDFLHKLTTWLVRSFDVICLEDLNIKGMMKNRKLARAVADIGLFELKRQLRYKAEWYGKTVQIIDRWYPSSKTCSSCGLIKSYLPLSDRVFRCEGCGHEQCRDLNAARNIEREGLRLLAVG
jgi:putative transposase